MLHPYGERRHPLGFREGARGKKPRLQRIEKTGIKRGGLRGVAEFGVAGFDGGVDEVDALVVGEEGALHGIDGDFFEVVDGESVSFLCGLEFLGHAGVTHQAIVGIEGDAKFFLIEDFEGMLGEAARGTGVDVADQADFQRNSFVEDVLGEVPQFHHLSIGDGDVFDQTRTVSDPVRSAILNGLPDRFLAEAFAGMNGDIEILALDIVKRFDVFLGRVTAFFSREIESHDATFAKIYGEFGHFERHVHVAHGANDQA